MLSARHVWSTSPGRPGLTRPFKEVATVKKLLVLGVAALGGFLVWKKIQADKLEQDLWTEATQETADLR
jgi:hypothetical protein